MFSHRNKRLRDGRMLCVNHGRLRVEVVSTTPRAVANMKIEINIQLRDLSMKQIQIEHVSYLLHER